MADTSGLLDVQDVVDALNVEHDEDDEQIRKLVSAVQGRLQRYIRYPVKPQERVEHHDGGDHRLFLRWPYADPDTMVVVDTQGTSGTADDETLVEGTDYRYDPETSIVWRTNALGDAKVWARGIRRWKVTYTAGLRQHPEWELGVADDVKGSLVDLAVHLYENADPGRVREGFGGGVSTQVQLDGLPPRVEAVWRPLRWLTD